MIYHCIRMTIRPDVPMEEVAAVMQRMQAATDEMPTAKSHIMGRDIGGEYQFGAISVFEDLETYERMMNHPAHLDIDRIGLPIVGKFMSFDVTDDPDPEIAAKIEAIHERRYAAHPDIAQLVAGLDEYQGSAAPLKK